MQNVPVSSKPKLHVLSDGALDFCPKFNMMYRKTDKAESCSRELCLHPPAFSAHITQLTGKPSAQFERTENSSLQTALRFTFTLYLYIISAFEGHENA
jgi:hypothetical protein